MGLGVVLKAGVKFRVLSGPRTWHNHCQGIVGPFAQEGSPFIGHVTKLMGGIHDPFDLLAAYISLAVEYIGDGSLGDTGPFRNIFDRYHKILLYLNLLYHICSKITIKKMIIE